MAKSAQAKILFLEFELKNFAVLAYVINPIRFDVVIPKPF